MELKSDKEIIELLDLYLTYYLHWNSMAEKWGAQDKYKASKKGYDAIPNPPDYLLPKK